MRCLLIALAVVCVVGCSGSSNDATLDAVDDTVDDADDTDDATELDAPNDPDADDADDSGDYPQACNELAGIPSGFANEKITLAGSADETRAKINAAWNAGAALVTYCGHGGISQLLNGKRHPRRPRGPAREPA